MRDDWARSVLSDPDLGPEPPSTVDVGRAVRDGRRRARAGRRTVVLVAAGTAVVMAAVPVALAFSDRDGGVRGGGAPATSSATAVSTAPAPPPSAPAACTREPLTMPDGAVDGVVHAGDPTGRYLVGMVYRVPAAQREGMRDYVIDPDGGNLLVLWDDGRPTVLRPPVPGQLQGVDVNAAGTVALGVVADHESDKARAVNWVYRDGRFTPLATPGRLHSSYSAMSINARGDVAAAWLDAEGVHPPLVWPSGTPDRPRTLTGGDSGDTVAAAVGGIDDDGTVVGTAFPAGVRERSATSPPPREETRSRPVFWSPGGKAQDLPLPAGFGPDGWVFDVRDGIAVGHLSRPDPDADRRGNRAVVWNLRTRTASIDDRLATAEAVNAHGWLVGRTPGDPPGPTDPPEQPTGDSAGRPAAVFNGRLVPVPMPAPPAPDAGGAVTISDDGRVLGGFARTDADTSAPVRWICS